MLSWIWSLGAFVAAMSVVDWGILALGVGLLLYWVGTKTHDHFRRRGLPFATPLPFFGNLASVMFGRVSMNDFVLNLYKQFDGRQAVGFFQFMKPTVIIRDPELIKLVAVKEFDHFVDHVSLFNEKVDEIFSRNIFSLTGQEWRNMRATLSPAFTASKMRNIFKLIDLCGEQMSEFLKRKIKTSPGGVYEAEMKDFFSRFANDVIATSAFGIECDSLDQPENEFYRMGRELTNTQGIKTLIFFGYILCPKLMDLLGIPFISVKVSKFFHNLVHDTINEREKKGIFRPDMLQLLMQTREGKLKAEADEEQEVIKGAKMLKLSDVDISAQATVFFFAVFDTVSTGLSYCAYALARHPDAQDRVQREVDEAFEKHGGKLTYEAATQDLKYCDMFINEVLRLYAAAALTDRKCTKDFTIPADGDIPAYTVKKDDVIWIPVYPLQRDPKYWDDPEKFDPERFSDENKHKIKPFTYMPFGVGPRICIGSRFALLETKVALAHILRRFNFHATEKTPKKVQYKPNDFSGGMKGGFWVGISAREE